jgi:hypothetical protein
MLRHTTMATAVVFSFSFWRHFEIMPCGWTGATAVSLPTSCRVCMSQHNKTTCCNTHFARQRKHMLQHKGRRSRIKIDHRVTPHVKMSELRLQCCGLDLHAPRRNRRAAPNHYHIQLHGLSLLLGMPAHALR